MILAVTAQEGARQWTREQSSDLVAVGLACQTTEPDQAEIEALVDEALEGALGPRGLRALVNPGDKVVIKVNIVEPLFGLNTERGRAIITDPRVARYVAEKVRAIIGTGGTADLKVVDACFTDDPDPSSTQDGQHGFRYAYYERTGNRDMDEGDVCYDYDRDGILDGASNATLVNSDAYLEADRFITRVTEPDLGAIDIQMPKFLRTKEQALAAGEPDDYCDVHINIAPLKTHRGPGLTVAIKNIYGYAIQQPYSAPNTRYWHGGAQLSGSLPNQYMRNGHLLDQYLSAHHQARGFDLTIVDAIASNRRGPTDPHFSRGLPVDYILSNAILACTDSVAIDTACALFIGYDPESIEMIERCRKDGIGVSDPARIRFAGLDKLTRHRDWMLETYGSTPEPEFYSQTGEMLYPFPAGHGDTLKFEDFDEPENVTLSQPAHDDGTTYTFTVHATENQRSDSGIVRVELIVDGNLIGYETAGLDTMPVTIQADLAAYSKGRHTCQAAVWDATLNCGVSNTVSFEFIPLEPAAANHWEGY